MGDGLGCVTESSARDFLFLVERRCEATPDSNEAGDFDDFCFPRPCWNRELISRPMFDVVMKTSLSPVRSLDVLGVAVFVDADEEACEARESNPVTAANGLR